MPISEYPVAASVGADGLANKIDLYLKAARAKAADGLTLAEFTELGLGAIRISVHALDALAMVAGDEKKRIVLEISGNTFDALADYMVPLAVKPVWWLVRPAARSLAQTLASGAIEAILPLVRGDES